MQVLEETGCDVSTLLNLDDYIEVSIGQQRVRLYIVTGVKRDTVFAPQTKKEISVCIVLNLVQSLLFAVMHLYSPSLIATLLGRLSFIVPFLFLLFSFPFLKSMKYD